MRRRYQVNLYTEHSKHLDLIEHLMSFDKNKRSSELTMLLLAGYQVLYGKGDTGFDRSTSTLLEEQERLLAILAARQQAPGLSGHPQFPSVNYPEPPSVSGTPREPDVVQKGAEKSPPMQEVTGQKEADQTQAGGFNRGGDSKESMDSVKDRRKESISSDEKPKEPVDSTITKDYDSNDLADEDPSITGIEDQDLDEDIVDPLSLLG